MFGKMSKGHTAYKNATFLLIFKHCVEVDQDGELGATN